MTKYVLVFTGGGMPESEEEQTRVMAAWGAWYEGLGAAVVDPGNPFGPEARNIVPNRTVNAGAIGAQATGYTILQADSMDAAVNMAKGCPMLDGNGQITVYETFDIM